MVSGITEVLLQQVLRDGSSCFLQQHAEPSLAFVSFCVSSELTERHVMCQWRQEAEAEAWSAPPDVIVLFDSRDALGKSCGPGAVEAS